LLISVLLFIVWSHVSPLKEGVQEEGLPASLSETGSNHIESGSGV
jgi:hypothetical protein